VSGRLIAVLGYSARRSDGLHAVCAARLRHAEQVASGADTVVLSGWARRNGAGEGELMRMAWEGADVRLISDATARNTRENAARVAETARRLGASEILVVTSRWHTFRARTLIRAILRERASTCRRPRQPVALPCGLSDASSPASPRSRFT
jgi:uncharacterized SAM-binding protein YcdF (DUF218 family)